MDFWQIVTLIGLGLGAVHVAIGGAGVWLSARQTGRITELIAGAEQRTQAIHGTHGDQRRGPLPRPQGPSRGRLMMIEAQYIRALCDRFEAYLTPLEIHILRLRYNGETLLLPKAVGGILGLSDERVRQLEARVLSDLASCLDLEAHGQEPIAIRVAKSFMQPVVSLICTGQWRSCSVPAYTAQGGELIIHAPHTPMDLKEFEIHLRGLSPYPDIIIGYPRDALIGRVLLTDCFTMPIPHPHPHRWVLVFEQPELFQGPIPYTGSPHFFHLPQDISQQLPPRYPFPWSGVRSQEP